jgi:hypothetical protein
MKNLLEKNNADFFLIFSGDGDDISSIGGNPEDFLTLLTKRCRFS